MPGSVLMEVRDGVALLRLAKGVTNAICPDLVEEFAGAVRSIEERYAEKERIFLECWHSEGTQARLREAAERF